ncbi:MAG: hypothetical protein OXL68_21850 [Paracoccaceae bacterium]|nr:hypothetical protein [Paracoccaceae bacterium]
MRVASRVLLSWLRPAPRGGFSLFAKMIDGLLVDAAAARVDRVTLDDVFSTRTSAGPVHRPGPADVHPVPEHAGSSVSGTGDGTRDEDEPAAARPA